MTEQDVRWKQRLRNYEKALEALSEAIETARLRSLSRLEKQGLIKAFEFTFELAWTLIKDYLEFQGITEVTGSRDAFREALSGGLIGRGEDWMAMIPSRNQTSHIYNESVADDVSEDIKTTFYPLFKELETILRAKAGD